MPALRTRPVRTPPNAPAVPAIPPKHSINVGELRLGPRERNYLQQVIDSNRLSYGPFTQKFEQEFARLHGCAHACFCNSGTSALQIALFALRELRGWKPGDEVIVPSVTFVATLNVVLLAGLRPVLVDVHPDTYTIDPELIRQAITPRTRCIIPVHLLGLPADMDPILELARYHNLAVVEDSCETMFARYKGRPVGSMGDIGCFSTYVAHFLVTGVGGFTTTRNPQLAQLCRSLMNHGRDNIYISIDDDNHVSGKEFHEVIDRRFRFERVGFSYRCTEMEAAIGLAQLEDHEAIVRARKQNAEAYSRDLADLSDVLQLPMVPPGREHAFMVYGLAVREGSMRPLLYHLEERGIETRDMLPLIHQPAYQALLGPRPELKYPIAGSLHDRAFYIGCHQHLTAADRQFVVESIRSYFRQ